MDFLAGGIHLRQKKTAHFLSDLAMIASFDADNIDVRRAAGRAVPDPVTRLGREMGRRLPAHQRLRPRHPRPAGRRPVMGKKFEHAAHEYQVALALKPKRPDDVKVKLARAQFELGQRDAPRPRSKGVLKADPDHPEAKGRSAGDRQGQERVGSEQSNLSGACVADEPNLDVCCSLSPVHRLGRGTRLAVARNRRG